MNTDTVLVRGPHLEKCKPDDEIVTFSCIKDENEQIENSTKKLLEGRLAALEHGKHALCFSSGLAAVTSISMLLSKGDHVVTFDTVYHGTRTELSIREALGHIDVTFTDLTDPNILEEKLQENTRMVWIESPCNPTMKLVDIAQIAKIVKKHGKAFFVVDNTFMSAYFQNPLRLGADIVMHSLTKYMNGHSDVLMGAAVMNDFNIYSRLKETSKMIGSLPSPMDCYLVLRGLKTLHLRMQQHMENAMKVATFLETHPNVEKVIYPGLASHPQHDLACRQGSGFSGMVAFCIRGGSVETRRFASKIKLLTLAVSLGSCETLVDIPSLMTASALSRERRLELGITDNLIRLSVGLEDAKDLIQDLDQALS